MEFNKQLTTLNIGNNIDSDRVATITLGFILLVSFCLRVAFIADKSIWHDEAWSIFIASHSFAEQIALLQNYDTFPPFYTFLLGAVQQVFGDGEFAMRMPSAIASSLSTYFIYRLTRDFWGSSAALIAAFLYAISPWHIEYAQEARSYAFVFLFFCMYLHALQLTILNWSNTRYWIYLTISASLSMYSHAVATVIIPVVLNAALFSIYVLQALNLKKSFSLPAAFYKRWVLSQCISLLFWLPWSAAFVAQSTRVNNEFWIQPPTLTTLFNTLESFTFQHMPTQLPFHEFWVLAYTVLVLIGLVLSFQRNSIFAIVLFFTLIGSPIVVTIISYISTPIFINRILIWASLPFFVYASIGLIQLAERVKVLFPKYRHISTTALTLVLIGMTGICALSVRNWYNWVEKDPWRAVANHVAQTAIARDLVIFHAHDTQVSFDYYYDRLESPPTINRVGVPKSFYTAYVRERYFRETDLDALKSLINQHETIWLIYSQQWFTDKQEQVLKTLDSNKTLSAHTSFRNIDVYLYE